MTMIALEMVTSLVEELVVAVCEELAPCLLCRCLATVATILRNGFRCLLRPWCVPSIRL